MSGSWSIVGRCLVPVLLATWAAGCNEDEEAWRSFDGPIDVAIMMPNEILDVPVGFVTNFRSSKIVKMDLLHDTPLRDRVEGSWIRSMPIATGRDRLVEQIAVATDYVDPSNYYVTLFASDTERNVLLVVPYLDTQFEWGPHCIPPAPSCTPGEPVGDLVCGPQTGFIPRAPICIPELKNQGAVADSGMAAGVLEVWAPDGSATGYVVTGFRLREGKTSTETWTGVYDAGVGHFVVRGSRSGVQERIPVIGETYWSDDNEIEIVVEQSTPGATLPDGAYFTFSTDSGIREIPMPGTIQDLRVDPETRRLFVTAQASEELEDGQFITRGYLVVLDLAPLASRDLPVVEHTWTLCPTDLDDQGQCPADARPMAMDLDPNHLRLFVSDASDAGVIYRYDLELADLAPEALPGFLPNLDVAYVEDLETEEGYQHLFVANADVGSVSLYDVRTEELIDINPFTPEVDAIELYSPVSGLAGSRVAVKIPEATTDQAQRQSILVGATTYKGDLWAIKGEDGCLMFATPEGAHLDSNGWQWGDQGASSNPQPAVDPETGRSVVTSSCGGVTRGETWYFVYDETLQGYRVRGSRANKGGTYQSRLAYEDERFVSDGGEISVLIRSGTLPTTDGDTWYFRVDSGLRPPSVEDLPSDFEIYTQEYGDRSEEWTEVNFRSLAIVPATLSDLVYKVNLASPNLADQLEVIVYH